MVEPIYNAACYGPELQILIEFEKAYLFGRSQQKTFTRALEYAISCQNVCAIKNLLKIDVDRVRQLSRKGVNVNAIAPNAISRAIQGERTDVEILRLFLDLGLDVKKVFGGEGDALMWAVRIGRWELVERILEQRGSFDVDEVKVGQNPLFETTLRASEPAYHVSMQYHKYDNKYTLLAVASDRIRVADELHYYEGHDTQEIPIWIDQKRLILEFLSRGASIEGTCLLPNLAADQQRKEQTVSFARMLIEEYGANVNERYEWNALMHRRSRRERISTPLYEAVRNNFLRMVELLLEKGADTTVKGHAGMTLVECAWNNKHGSMVQLLRERGVPEGPETKGKDVWSLYSSSTPARATTPVRRTVVRSDSSSDELDADERRRIMYQAIQP